MIDTNLVLGVLAAIVFGCLFGVALAYALDYLFFRRDRD